MMNDPLANALSLIMNAEARGKKACLVSPSSKLIRAVLGIMNRHHYLGSIEDVESSGAGVMLKVNLIGALNKCGAVKPRFVVKRANFERFESKLLPAKDFGFLVVSTSKGLLTHAEAKEKSLGGRLIAYFY